MRYAQDMKRVRTFATACVAVLLVGGTVYAWQNKTALLAKLGKKQSQNTQQNVDTGKEQAQLLNTQQIGEVLGETQKNIVDTVQTVQSTVGDTFSQILSSVTTQDQKIEIDKAVQQVQQKAANIPQEIFEKARYEYCKQVVSDYENR